MTPDWNNPEPQQEYVLTITQNENDLGFASIEEWLESDERVIRFGRDEGQWYSNGEARGEWHAIRISVQYQFREALQNDLQDRIERDLPGSCLEVVCM